jgi:hypothetical protein
VAQTECPGAAGTRGCCRHVAVVYRELLVTPFPKPLVAARPGLCPGHPELIAASNTIFIHLARARLSMQTKYAFLVRLSRTFRSWLAGGIVAMDRGKSGCALLVLLAASGCHMCNHCSDYAPVVIDGPYSHVSGRAGSVLSGSPMPLPGVITEQAQQRQSTAEM